MSVEQERDERAARFVAAWAETWVWFCVTILPWVSLVLMIAWVLK